MSDNKDFIVESTAASEITESAVKWALLQGIIAHGNVYLVCGKKNWQYAYPVGHRLGLTTVMDGSISDSSWYIRIVIEDEVSIRVPNVGV